MTITIVGLGPGDAQQITREAWSVLVMADEVYLRTEHHPTVKGLPDHLSLHSFDHVYDQAQSFDEVYDNIAAQVIQLGQRPQGVVYAVPGHPLVGEIHRHAHTEARRSRPGLRCASSTASALSRRSW